MPLYRFLRRVRRYFGRRDIDWTLTCGDRVVDDSWPQPVTIVAMNWSLQAAAVELGPDMIVVWPLWRLHRDEA